MRTVLLILSGLMLFGILVPAVWGQARPPATGHGPEPVVPAAAVPELLKPSDRLDENRDGRLDDRELERFAK